MHGLPEIGDVRGEVMEGGLELSAGLLKFWVLRVCCG